MQSWGRGVTEVCCYNSCILSLGEGGTRKYTATSAATCQHKLKGQGLKEEVGGECGNQASFCHLGVWYQRARCLCMLLRPLHRGVGGGEGGHVVAAANTLIQIYTFSFVSNIAKKGSGSLVIALTARLSWLKNKYQFGKFHTIDKNKQSLAVLIYILYNPCCLQ